MNNYNKTVLQQNSQKMIKKEIASGYNTVHTHFIVKCAINCTIDW